MSGPEQTAPDLPHDTSLAVWDLPSPAIAGRRATVKAGIACSSGCNLSGARIDVHNETGQRTGSGEAGSAPWPGTTSLYWVELDVAAPDMPGECAWTLRATASGPHAPATSMVRVVVAAAPQHRVTIAVTEKGSGGPVPGVDVRVGMFRGATGEAGIAQIDVPAGRFDVVACKIGYETLSSTIEVAGDIAVHLKAAPASEPEQPYWM
ncbi:MAG: hypothetical protein HY824_15835 [Acidobacteria bacterium]|nr:hypothetical protein [Acidobacteriota bacterium]